MKTLSLALVTALLSGLVVRSSSAQSGALDLSFMNQVGPDAAVQAVVVQADGRAVVVGSFTRVNLAPRDHLARLNPDGSLDAEFSAEGGADGLVNALVLQSDGRLLVGGGFTHLLGAPLNRIARLEADGTLDPTFDPGTGADGEIAVVLVNAAGQILIWGSFTQFDGAPRQGLARLRSNGRLDPAFDPGSRAASNVLAVALQADGKVLLGGSYTHLEGTPASYLARLNADGSLDTAFCATASATTNVFSLALQNDDKIVVAGWFTHLNGTARSRIGRLNPDGSLDATFDPGTGLTGQFRGGMGRFYPPAMQVVVQPDGQCLVWGNFTSCNGVARLGVARLSATGGLQEAWAASWGIAALSTRGVGFETNGTILVGRTISSYLVRLQSDGTTDPGYLGESGPDYEVYAVLAQPDGRLVLGGEFESVHGHPQLGLSRLNPDGSLDLGFQGGAGTGAYVTVNCLAQQPDGRLLAGGSFTQFNGVGRTNLVRLNENGSLDPSFDPGSGSDDEVTVLALQPDGKVLVGGQFGSWNGRPAPYLARLNPDGTVDETFDPGAGPDDEVRTISLQPDGHILVGGRFTAYGDTPRPGLVRLQPDGTLDPSFQPALGAESTVWAIALQPDGRIVVSGDLFEVAGVTWQCLARLLPDGGLDTTFEASLYLEYPRSELLIQPDGRILIAGDFVIETNTPQGRIARLNPDGTLDSSFDPGSGADNDVFALALQADGKLLLGGRFHRVNDLGRSMIARLSNEVGAPLQVPAAVTVQAPAYLTTWVGSNGLFGVSAAGTPPLSFQWQLNDTNLPGQSGGSCWFTAVGSAQAGRYTLVVSNALGAVTSAPTRLFVLPASARPGLFDSHFAVGTGPDDAVWSVAEQPDGKLLIGGNFKHFDGRPQGGIVRLNADGTRDPGFVASGVGGISQVYGVVPQPDGKLLVSGWFTEFNGQPAVNFVRLNANGTTDTGFKASFDVSDPNGWTWPIVVQPDGRILVGGYFGQVNEGFYSGIVRLNSNGKVDTSFNPGAGADSSVSALLLQPDGKIVLGGAFGFFDGIFCGGIVRLTANGQVDPEFNPGMALVELTDHIEALALQPDGKVILGGWFTHFSGQPRTNLARLNPDGSLDRTFAPPTPVWLAERTIYGLALQPDGKLLVGAWPNTGAGGPCVGRFYPDGTLDPSFTPGFTSADGAWCLAYLTNGQMVVGGGFPDFNERTSPYLVRLHGDESLTPAPVWLSARLSDGLWLEWPSAVGVHYQLQSSTKLPATTWNDEGAAFPGTGTVLSTNLPTSLETTKYYRLRLE